MQKCRIHMIKQSLMGENSKENESFIADFIETNGRLNFRYQEIQEDATVQVMADADAVEIVRHGEVTSHIKLLLGNTGEVVVDSPFGRIEMESYTIDIKKSANILLVEYQLLQQDDVVAHFQIIWKIMKEEMS